MTYSASVKATHHKKVAAHRVKHKTKVAHKHRTAAHHTAHKKK